MKNSIKFTIPGADTINTANGMFPKGFKYPLPLVRRMESVRDCVIEQTRGFGMTGLLRLDMEVSTCTKSTIDTINVAHFVLNSCRRPLWDDSQFWELHIRRVLNRMQPESTSCIITRLEEASLDITNKSICFDKGWR